MKLTPIAVAAALASSAAAAQEGPTQEEVQTYAAFSKLEANIAELGLAVSAHALMPPSMAETRAIIAEEFDEDVEQVAGYVTFLRSVPLTAEQTEALDAFETSWGELVSVGRGMMAEDFNPQLNPSAVAGFWAKATETDETIDDVLDAMQESLNADIPGT